VHVRLASSKTKASWPSFNNVSIGLVVRRFQIYHQFLDVFICIFLGPFLTRISANDIVPSRPTITREIQRQAIELRQQLKIELIQAAKEGTLAISPDLWTDRFKQNCYLGLTAHFVDNNYKLHTVDLSCEPYNEIDKRADSILKVFNKKLL